MYKSLGCFSLFPPSQNAEDYGICLRFGDPEINLHMGMALKTLWIVPRWSGRLERGGYVKGHDPDVSKAPTRRSCFHDMTSYVYMSLWLGQRSHGKVERSIPAGPAIVFTLRIQFDCKDSCYRWHEFQSQWSANQEFEERKETKQSQVLTQTWLWVWIGVGCGLDRVWIGLDPGLDRPRSGPTCLWCCSLDAAWQEKDDKVCRQQVYSLAAWQAGLTTCNSVSVWQLGCATVAAWLLDCLTA